MKTGDITSEKFFAEIKSNPTVQTLLSNEVISTALEDKYSDKVTSDDVEKEYAKMKEQYGDQFQSALVSAGLNEDTYKAQLRSTLLLDYAVKTAAEQELKDSDYEEAFKSYTPTMTVKFVKTKTKDEAKTVVDELKKETAVDTLVAKYGTLSKADQKTGELTFDSTTKDVEPELLAQITPMEVNKVSEPIAITDRKTYETVYYVVKVTKKDAKKESWKDYEAILKDYIINKKASDKNYAKQVVAELLKEYKENHEKGESTFKGEEKYRIMFEGIACWPWLRATATGLKSRGINMVTTIYADAFGFIYDDFDGMCRAYANVPNCMNIEHARDKRTKLCKDNSVEGLLVHTNRSCKLWSGFMSEMSRQIGEECGIPVVSFCLAASKSKINSLAGAKPCPVTGNFRPARWAFTLIDSPLRVP